MINQKTRINFTRLKGTINKSAEIGEIPGNGLRRLALSNEDKKMRDLFRTWMEDANLLVRVDDFGNMYGHREGRENLSPILIGSHLDTQPNGGRFDGVLGVLSALEVIRTLNDNNIQTTRPIEIVNFTNEEGARFEPPMIASGGLSGAFDKEYVYSRQDMEGKFFEDELERIEYKGKKENRIEYIHSYVELHIEQGPVLESEGISIGTVEGIQGMHWLEIVIDGEPDHAGPTPMHLRKDALTASSKMINAIEKIATDRGVTATVGRLSLKPNVTNCIPGRVTFSVDTRHFSNEKKQNAVDDIKKAIESIASDRKVTVKVDTLWDAKTVEFNPYIMNLIEKSAFDCSYTVKKMPSGAGHDAKYIHDMAPTAMIFLPSVNGKSHVESELTLDQDIEQGANVLLKVIQHLANQEKSIRNDM